MRINDEGGSRAAGPLGEFEKPPCKLLGEDSNVFAIIGSVRKALKRAGQRERAEEFTKRATSSHSYDEVLNLLDDYVEVC